jgi:hypothetical protein
MAAVVNNAMSASPCPIKSTVIRRRTRDEDGVDEVKMISLNR